VVNQGELELELDGGDESSGGGRHRGGLNRRRYWRCGHSQCAFMEFNVTQNPVNQQIVVGEPAMSEDQHTGGIQQSYIECFRVDFACGELNVEFNGFGNEGVHRTVQEVEFKQSDCVGFKRVFINKFAIYETVARARVNESGNRRNSDRGCNGNGRHKGVQIGESGCVEV